MRKSKNKTSPIVIILVVGILVVINTIYFVTRGSDDDSEVAEAALVKAPTDDVGVSENRKTEELLRAKGLQHIVNDEYDEAVKVFSEALAISDDKGNISGLLELAIKKRDQQLAAVAVDSDIPPTAEVPDVPKEVAANAFIEPELDEVKPAADVPDVPDEPDKPRRVTPTPRRQKYAKNVHKERRKPQHQPPKVNNEPTVGTVVVSSKPSLSFSVDGVSKGISPSVVKLAPGSHSIAFLYQGKSLATRRVNVSAGQKVVVDVNLESERDLMLAANTAERNRIALEKSQEEARKEEARENAILASNTPPVKEKPPVEEPIVAKTPSKVGRIFVQSPGLSGIVYVNGKRYGKAPVLVKNVRIGRAKIEIRSNGRKIRSSSVTIKENGTKQVQFR